MYVVVPDGVPHDVMSRSKLELARTAIPCSFVDAYGVRIQVFLPFSKRPTTQQCTRRLRGTVRCCNQRGVVHRVHNCGGIGLHRPRGLQACNANYFDTSNNATNGCGQGCPAVSNGNARAMPRALPMIAMQTTLTRTSMQPTAAGKAAGRAPHA